EPQSRSCPAATSGRRSSSASTCSESGRLTPRTEFDLRRVQAADWEALRAVRLRSLADAPDAFATTHAEAVARPEKWWRDWGARTACDRGQAMFLAWDGADAIGIGGAYGGPARFDVVSMWTDPAWRGRGVGAALLQAAIAFAGDAPVFLSVTENND